MVRHVRSILRFPASVNETSARLVAAGVVLQAVAFLVTRQGWILVPLVYGFAARVAAGPTLSPLGQLVSRVVTPRLSGEHRVVPGPPKRFAQGVGLVVSGAAGLAWLAGSPLITEVALAVLVIAASLEALAAVCVGCIVYRFLWECEDCADISDRLRVAAGDVTART